MSNSAPKNGGPAFPFIWNVGHNSDWESEEGMSLRDHFAGQALPAIIVVTSAGQHMPSKRDGDSHIRFAIARDAYAMADAMLAARGEHGDD